MILCIKIVQALVPSTQVAKYLTFSIYNKLSVNGSSVICNGNSIPLNLASLIRPLQAEKDIQIE